MLIKVIHTDMKVSSESSEDAVWLLSTVGGSWFLTRERMIMQLGLRRHIQPRGRGRGGKVHWQLFSSAERMAKAESWR